MYKKTAAVLLLIAMACFLAGCGGESKAPSVDLTGSWVGVGSHSTGLRATIRSDTITIKYKPTSDLEKVIWSGSYSAATGDPPSFVSVNDNKYTHYLGTLTDPSITFVYENGRLTFSSKKFSYTYQMVRK